MLVQSLTSNLCTLLAGARFQDCSAELLDMADVEPIDFCKDLTSAAAKMRERVRQSRERKYSESVQ